MAIEFPCAKCGQQVRTPDTAAGKKGKCPSCGQVQRIPGGPAAAPPAPTPTRPVAPKQRAQPVPPPQALKPPAPPAQSPAPMRPAAPTAPPASPPMPAPPTHLKPAAASLIKPDPPSLTPAQPAPLPEKTPEPKLLNPAGGSGKSASQWTSYVKRGAEAIRPLPMPAADPRIAPRSPATKQVLPRLTPEPEQRLPETTSHGESRAASPNRLLPQPAEPVPAAATPAGAPGDPSHIAPGAPLAHGISSEAALPSAAPHKTPAAEIDKPVAAEETSPAIGAPQDGVGARISPIEQGKKWDTTPATQPEIPSLTPVPVEEDLPELTPLTSEQIAQLTAAALGGSTPALTPLGPVAGAAPRPAAAPRAPLPGHPQPKRGE